MLRAIAAATTSGRTAANYTVVMPRELTRLSDREYGRWEMIVAAPHASLRQHVRRYVGFVERRTVPILRRELPGSEIPVVINFGAPIRLFDAGDTTRSTVYGSFASGVYDSFVVVESNGYQNGIQIDFTILGMRLFLGQPLGELKNRAVALDDVLGRACDQLVAQLRDLQAWDARFDLLDTTLSARMAAARQPSRDLLAAWTHLLKSGGAVPIQTIVRDVGRSHRHLISQFKDQIGLTPKALARVLRFRRAVRVLKGDDVRLADVALACGYCDQPHFDRDFRAFAGLTPTELMRSRMPDGGFAVR